ncbi:glycosyltransferase [Frigoribacterium sp. 2-23]|uniref:glycosyltransferase n=1 Tax=Frigoribacterium sp. 2-23 TaxID=3415006 RepID=UPI003C70429B
MKNTTATVEPLPRQVITVDLDGPEPVAPEAGHYGTAMVVGRVGGVPVGVVDLDVETGGLGTEGFALAVASLRSMADQVSAAARSVAPKTPIADADLPSITVVVSTIVGRDEDLELLLDGFAHVDYPDVEFLIVDNRTSLPPHDRLPELVAGRDRVRVVAERRPGISAGRNAGVAAARGEIIAFTDDDVRVEPNWLRALGTRFARDPGLDAATGLILPAELETPAQIWFERYYGGFSGERTFTPLRVQADPRLPTFLRGSRVSVRNGGGEELRKVAVYGVGAFGAGANMAFRASALRRVGGFDTALGTGTPARGGEDLATMISILWTGGALGYEPSAVVHHKHRRGLDELLKQLRGNGLGFTAMLTSLVLNDPRHLASLGYQLPLAVGTMLRQNVQKLVNRNQPSDETRADSIDDRYPRSLVISEMRDAPKGPGAYLTSRRVWRERTSGHGTSPGRTGSGS